MEGQIADHFQYFIYHKGEKYNVPTDTELPGTALKVPLVIVADETYPLLHFLMRPYTKRIMGNARRYPNSRFVQRENNC